MPAQRLRTKKLLQPRFQLRLVCEFFGLAAVGLCLQWILLGARLPHAISRIEATSGELVDALPGVLIGTFFLTCAVLFPILLAFGTLFTLRIAGPIYRFEKFLRAVANREQSAPCTIRGGDEFQQICELLNEVTEPLRAESRASETAAGDKAAQRAA